MQRGLDLNAVLQWRVSDTLDFVASAAWDNAIKAEEARSQFLAGLATSICKAIAASGDAIVKTLANIAQSGR